MAKKNNNTEQHQPERRSARVRNRTAKRIYYDNTFMKEDFEVLGEEEEEEVEEVAEGVVEEEVTIEVACDANNTQKLQVSIPSTPNVLQVDTPKRKSIAPDRNSVVTEYTDSIGSLVNENNTIPPHPTNQQQQQQQQLSSTNESSQMPQLTTSHGRDVVVESSIEQVFLYNMEFCFDPCAFDEDEIEMNNLVQDTEFVEGRIEAVVVCDPNFDFDLCLFEVPMKDAVTVYETIDDEKTQFNNRTVSGKQDGVMENDGEANDYGADLAALLEQLTHERMRVEQMTTKCETSSRLLWEKSQQLSKTNIRIEQLQNSHENRLTITRLENEMMEKSQAMREMEGRAEKEQEEINSLKACLKKVREEKIEEIEKKDCEIEKLKKIIIKLSQEKCEEVKKYEEEITTLNLRFGKLNDEKCAENTNL